MKSKQLNQIVDTMNVMDRARALRGMHQAILLANVADAIATRARRALESAGRALTVVYDRGGR
jgi:hypothetical protein